MISPKLAKTLKYGLVSVVISVASLSMGGLLVSEASFAQSIASDATDEVKENEYPDLTTNGRPNDGQRQGFGSRGCGVSGARAIIPPTNLAIPTSQAPSLWVYVPYTSDELQTLEMRIWDTDSNSYIYETVLTSLNQLPGTVGVMIPQSSSLLQAGKKYRWELKIDFLCISEETNQETTGSDFMDGFIQISNGQGTWYDAMVREGSQLCTGRSSPEWGRLLNMVGFGDIATEPVVACLNPANSQ